MAKELNLFEFHSYRLFLRAWLEEAKSKKSSNMTRLAQEIGVHPTYLSHILNEKKDLSAEQAMLVCEHLKLTKLEREYFFVLLQLERAGSAKLKNYYLEKKAEIIKEKDQLKKRFDHHHELSDTERAIYYSSWLYSAISVATDIGSGQTLTDLSEKFGIHRDVVQRILDFLLGVGVVRENKGLYTLGEIHVHVPIDSPFAVKHHTNWRIKSMQKMDTRSPEELFLTAPMSISLEDFALIRENLNTAIKKIVDIAKKSPAERVVCLNIDFFNVG